MANNQSGSNRSEDEVPGESEPAARPSPSPAEHRWPAAVSVLVALVLYALLPTRVMPWTVRLPVLVLCAILLAVVIAVNPLRMRRDYPWLRRVSVGLAILVAAANYVALARTIIVLVVGPPPEGPEMLIAALQVWMTNLIAFALLFWELDRGGPVRRHHAPRSELPPADLRFPQDEDADAITEVAASSSEHTDWRPSFVDYFYESSVNAMAFTPVAAAPLTTRAKWLLVAQGLAGFILLALVIAQAVGQLGQ